MNPPVNQQLLSDVTTYFSYLKQSLRSYSNVFKWVVWSLCLYSHEKGFSWLPTCFSRPRYISFWAKRSCYCEKENIFKRETINGSLHPFYELIWKSLFMMVITWAGERGAPAQFIFSLQTCSPWRHAAVSHGSTRWCSLVPPSSWLASWLRGLFSTSLYLRRPKAVSGSQLVLNVDEWGVL